MIKSYENLMVPHYFAIVKVMYAILYKWE